MDRGLKSIVLMFLLITTVPTLVFSLTDSEKKGSKVNNSEFNWELVWSDEFNSKKIDESKWNFVIGAGGYGNNELQFYSNRIDNARISKGKLIIEAHK